MSATLPYVTKGRVTSYIIPPLEIPESTPLWSISTASSSVSIDVSK